MATKPTRLGGLNDGPANMDALAIFYISFAAIHTAIIVSGLFVLFKLRKTHAVRIRNFPLICATIFCLHFYLVLILLVYPLNGLFKCGWEFWIMSTLLPLGMALFQASNIRLYSYAKEQKDVAEGKFFGKAKYKWKWAHPRPVHWFKHLSPEKQTYATICAGMMLQLIVTIVLFFGSRKFHDSYGVFAQHVDSSSCRRGTEWIPSVFWQFLWATVFGPYVLLRIRDIKDTHYWAWQTRLAIIACLPGTPLWLTFVYAQNRTLSMITRWFPPSGWFLPGLITMQFVTIFFPLLDVYRLKKLEREFGRNRNGFQGEALGYEKPRNPYSMATLELQLSKNPSNLLYWAYTKEFTAENIMFLTSVRDFKRKWAQVTKHTNNLNRVQLRERYEEAALIYFKLVNPQTARMNINIDYRTSNELQEIFKSCQYEAFMDDTSSMSKSSSCFTDNIVAPWADYDRPASAISRQSDEGKVMNDDVDKLYPLPVTEIITEGVEQEGAFMDNEVEIPAKFSLEVFDRAYEAVKNDVYLNTWVRFAQWKRDATSQDVESLHSNDSETSDALKREAWIREKIEIKVNIMAATLALTHGR